ncbi:MAG: tetratricopeptide repeat protein [Myxococcota bacterium]
MNRVEKAIESGRCAIAVSGSLLRDPEVMLALSERAGLAPMALSGPAVAPVIPVSADGVAHAVAEPDGVVLVVEPEGADTTGMQQLGALLQRGQHQPEIVVVARSYNPFTFGSALSGLKVDHEKGRGKAFIQGLPDAPAPAEGAKPVGAVAKIKKKGSDIPAPVHAFVGREEELEAMKALLGEGGPIVLSGSSGVGRHALLEHAIEGAEVQRLPDVWLGWGTGFDALISRIAEIARVAGHDALFELLKTEHKPVQAIDAAATALQHEGLAGKVLCIHRLEYGMGRDNDFFRKSRLEMLLIKLLTSTAALPVVFVSTRQPRFHREGMGDELRRIEIIGVKGRFFHEIFEANKAIEFPRERFGPISERLHGHPMAAKTFAIATRIRKDGEAITEDAKFMAMETVDDIAPLKKQLSKRVDKLPRELRAVLAHIAHVAEPVDGNFLSDLKVKRNTRLELMALGMLDMYGTQDNRLYRVHPLVRSNLTWREVSDFDLSAELAEHYQIRARKVDGAAKQALEHQQTRMAVRGRRLRLRPKTDLPDHDAWLESVTGMLRAKTPRFDLVEQRLNEALKQNPANSDAWLLKIELAEKHQNKVEAVEEVLKEAVDKAPVPELFHEAASFCLSRRARVRAIAIMEKGVEVFPDESRLRTRLGAIMLRQGRRNEGIDQLKTAMTEDPMLPDPYGLLGMAKRDEGLDSLEEAEQLLREAVRLAPGDPVQTARLADLLMDRARIEVDEQKELREEATTLLEDGIRGERRAPEACLMLATLTREKGGDLERANWLLKQARKLTDRQHERGRRIQVEQALIDMARGDLDRAEKTIRQLIERDPTHGRAFAALGHILEMREQYIPAHAEYQRAKERTSQNSLENQYYGHLLERVQKIIELQAAGMLDPTPAPTGPITSTTPPPGLDGAAGRVLRRSGEGESAVAADGVPATDAPATEAAPAEAPASEAAPAQPPVPEPAPAETAPVEAAPVEAAPAAPAPDETPTAEAAPIETPEPTAPETTVPAETPAPETMVPAETPATEAAPDETLATEAAPTEPVSTEPAPDSPAAPDAPAADGSERPA